ncbi:hypothetical protein [Corynebacterium guangdongense]|uniref:Uncharacterized protein n=1 Tax=Corynebacterium guangdongense TaxID=1783348 RepID=A0ABU1ZZN2_9CORY|nr:hypothetical protein [Corynebacterium guangdongense]MDR7330381.1 hypothetical protein [Corynebacterium guangdongense]
MTLTTTTSSHDHALACRDRPRTVALPAVVPAGSRTAAALAACLADWSRQIGALAHTLHRDWSEVVRVHRRVETQDGDTAAELRR